MSILSCAGPFDKQSGVLSRFVTDLHVSSSPRKHFSDSFQSFSHCNQISFQLHLLNLLRQARSTFHTHKKRNPLLGTSQGGSFSENVKTVLSDDFLWGHFPDLLVQKMQVREFQPVGHVQLPAEHEILRDFPHFEGRSFFFPLTPLTLKTTTSEDQHRQNQFLGSYHPCIAMAQSIRNQKFNCTVDCSRN